MLYEPSTYHWKAARQIDRNPSNRVDSALRQSWTRSSAIDVPLTCSGTHQRQAVDFSRARSFASSKSLLPFWVHEWERLGFFCDAFDMQQDDSWTCIRCGTVHAALTESYSFGAPWAASQIPTEELPERLKITGEFAVINKQTFLQGCIPIPVIGREMPFYWCVWASFSCKDFARAAYVRSIPDEYRRKEPNYLGELANKIEIYPNTLGLKLQIETRPFGQKHFFRLLPMQHSLAVEQRDGISLERLREISQLLEHKWQHPYS